MITLNTVAWIVISISMTATIFFMYMYYRECVKTRELEQMKIRQRVITVHHS